MKRFVDIRGQGTGSRFAFWDTIHDQFETHGTEMAWDAVDEFRQAYQGDELDRYVSLCPPWAFTADLSEDTQYALNA